MPLDLDDALCLPADWHLYQLCETADPSRPDRWFAILRHRSSPLIAQGQGRTATDALDAALDRIAEPDTIPPPPAWTPAPEAASAVLAAFTPPSRPIRRR